MPDEGRIHCLGCTTVDPDAYSTLYIPCCALHILGIDLLMVPRSWCSGDDITSTWGLTLGRKDPFTHYGLGHIQYNIRPLALCA